MIKLINTVTLRYPMPPGEVVLEKGGGITAPSSHYMPEGYAQVIETDPPEYDASNSKVVEISPERVEGTYFQRWEVIPLTEEEREFLRDSQVPSSCSPAQGLVSLFVLKQITEQDIVDAIETIEDPTQKYTARIGYSRATVWERKSTTIETIAALLHLTSKDLEDLFSYAISVNL